MISRTGPIQESYSWLGQLNPALPEIRIAMFTVQINKLLNEAQRLFETEPESLEQATARAGNLAQVSNVMEGLDTEISAVCDDVPPLWKVRWIDTVPQEARIQSLLTKNRVQVYHDIKVADLWNYERVSRVILLETRIQCLMCIRESQEIYATFADQTLDLSIKTSQETVCSTIDDILSSSPYLLGLLDQDGNPSHGEMGYRILGAYFLHTSLCILMRSKLLTEEQREKATAALQRANQQLKERR
jgi:hypothetical protein